MALPQLQAQAPPQPQRQPQPQPHHVGQSARPPAPGELFQPFSTTHVLVDGVFVLVTLGFVVIGRRLRGGPAGRRFEIALGVFNLASWVAFAAYWLVPGRFDWTRSLPLHMCDIAALAAPVALLSAWRWPRTLVYFWGLALSSQAFITPTLREGPAHEYFWMFWFQHAVIVGGAVYEVAVRGYRPTWPDWLLASAITVGYGVLVLPLNIALGANYGYVGASNPLAPTILDHLGPWPGRVLLIMPLVLLAFGLAAAPWALARRESGEFPEGPAQLQRDVS